MAEERCSLLRTSPLRPSDKYKEQISQLGLFQNVTPRVWLIQVIPARERLVSFVDLRRMLLISLKTSYAEEWSCSIEDSKRNLFWPSVDNKLIRILKKAVEEFGLELKSMAEWCLLSYTGSPSPQSVLWHHGPLLSAWTSSFASKADGSLSHELPRWLASASQVRAWAPCLQVVTTQPRGVPLGKNQFSQELPVPQPASRFLGYSYQFGPDMDLACARTLTDNSAASSVIQFGCFSTPQSIPEDAGSDGCHLLCDSIGSNLDAVPPILAQNPCPIPRLEPVDVFASRWLTGASQLWPLGRALACIRQASNWDWPPEVRWSWQMPPTQDGEHCARADRCSAPGPSWSNAYISTASKWWRFFWP